VIYGALQKVRGDVWMSAQLPGNGWKWGLGLQSAGVMGMTMALLISGYIQSFVERAQEGSTWAGYFAAQNHVWFIQGMYWRQFWGVITALGLIITIWDMLTIGKGETRRAQEFLPEHAPASAGGDATVAV
jgi:nitric oxide reductase subunit B